MKKTGSIVIEFQHSDPHEAWSFVNALERYVENVGGGDGKIKLTNVDKTIER